MKAQVKKYCNRYLEFSDDEIDYFYNILTPKTFEKKEYLLNEGEVCRNNFFIMKGIVRSFYINSKSEEKIVQFGIENWWITNTESFIKETPSLLYMQAIENTTVLILDKTNLEGLYTSIPKFESLFRIIAENTLIAIRRRSEFYMKNDSKERYNLFVNSFPDFAQRVPQYMIASYLDVTPEYLSTLRKNR